MLGRVPVNVATAVEDVKVGDCLVPDPDGSGAAVPLPWYASSDCVVGQVVAIRDGRVYAHVSMPPAQVGPRVRRRLGQVKCLPNSLKSGLTALYNYRLWVGMLAMLMVVFAIARVAVTSGAACGPSQCVECNPSASLPPTMPCANPSLTVQLQQVQASVHSSLGSFGSVAPPPPAAPTHTDGPAAAGPLWMAASAALPSGSESGSHCVGRAALSPKACATLAP